MADITICPIAWRLEDGSVELDARLKWPVSMIPNGVLSAPMVGSQLIAITDVDFVGTTLTVTAAAHGMVVGAVVNAFGVTSSGTLADFVNGKSYTISGVTYVGSTVTVTTTAAHGMIVGDSTVIAAVVSSGTLATETNGPQVVTAVGTTTFEFTAFSAPTGIYTSGGTVLTPGITTVVAVTTDTFDCLVGSTPTGTYTSGGTLEAPGQSGAVTLPPPGSQRQPLAGSGLFVTELELSSIVDENGVKLADFVGLSDMDCRVGLVAAAAAGQQARIIVRSQSGLSHVDLGLEPIGRGRVTRNGDPLLQSLRRSRVILANAFEAAFTTTGMPAPTIDTPGAAIDFLNDANGSHVVMTSKAAVVSTDVNVTVADGGTTATFTRLDAGDWIADGHFPNGILVVSLGAGTLSAGNLGSFPIVSVSTSVLTVTFASPIAEVAKIGTFTTIGSVAGLSSPTTASQRQLAPDIVFAISPALLECRVWFGLFDSDPTVGDYTDLSSHNIKGFGFWWDHALHQAGGLGWRAIQNSGAAQTETTPGIAATGNAHTILRCRHLGGNQFEFSNYNILLSSWEHITVQTTNGPGATDNLKIYCRLRNLTGSATRAIRVGMVDLFQI